MKKLKICSRLFIMIVTISCSSTKKIDKLGNSVEIKLPIKKSVYQDNKKYIKDIGYGKSDDIMLSIDIAKTNAISNISYKISTYINNSKEYTEIQDGDFNNKKYSNITKMISSQILNNIDDIETITFYSKDTDNFESWVVVEINKNDIILK
jgi:hypothetical protein